MKRMTVVLAGLSLLAGACTPSESPTPSPSGIPSPSGEAMEFDLVVAPDMAIGMTLGGARSVYLVTVSGSPEDPAVQITAEASGANVSVEPRDLVPGVVGEVTVVPDPVAADGELPVTIRGARGGVEREVERVLRTMPGEDSIAADAAAHLAPYLTWLGDQHPELGITEETAWDPTPGARVLVVEHYLYFSEDWELGLEWHVMIPPHDWSRIYLRQRWTEVHPSLAFEISSVSGGDEPHEITPPESVWR